VNELQIRARIAFPVIGVRSKAIKQPKKAPVNVPHKKLPNFFIISSSTLIL
jgi:hypothetical protein